jgi:methylase of polypeptide subunit release factors
VLPYAGLIREDTTGYPTVIAAGSVYVTQTSERRSTGTHYTPRSLTEPIVRHTLETLVYEGPAEGKPKEEWQLQPAKRLLELKVCDLAMGSGAFLVQACRSLSERLVEAWDAAERAYHGDTETRRSQPGESGDLAAEHLHTRTPEGPLFLTLAGELTAEDAPANRPLPAEAGERLALARRLVADHCLYGVDKNPMAVEMAKLSLWLITLAKGKPFSFLDHRLKHGDSLVGCMWRETPRGKLLPLPAEIPDAAHTTRPGDRDVIRRLRERNAARGRGQHTLPEAPLPGEDPEAHRKLADVPDTPEGMQQRAERYYALRRKPEAARRCAAADLWCAAWFWPLDREEGPLAPTTDLFLDVAEKSAEVPPAVAARVAKIKKRIPFFHWALEFPDVFAQGGFDAVVGNPPFLGGARLEPTLGADYREYLVHRLANGLRGVRGGADLCVYFLLRVTELLGPKGCAGLRVLHKR